MNLVDAFPPVSEMLQRPRNILITDDYPRFPQITSSWTAWDYHNTFTSNTQLPRHCQLNYNSVSVIFLPAGHFREYRLLVRLESRC